MGEAQSFRSTRNRQSLVDMVAWVRYVAQRPCHLADGSLPPDQTPISGYFALALLFREAMCAKFFSPSRTDESVPQKRQKVHPCMYADDLRSSERIILLRKKPPLAACSTGAEGPPDDSAKDWVESRSKIRKHIRIGLDYQAECPEWRSRASSSPDEPDAERFLGQRVWPQGTPERRSTRGLGGPVKCICARPGSMECAQLHIAEKRFHLRRELGSAFCAMGFDQMGEEVALSWSRGDEEEFMAAAHPSRRSTLEMSFWDEVSRRLPSRSRREVVSYYFNVFLLRRRGFQNRVTKGEAVSDDEEDDSSATMICVENEQCVEADDSDGG